jgi:hypothetical protein
VQGNHLFAGNLDLTGNSNSDVTGNRISGGNDLIISGSTDSVIQGNRVEGNLDVSSSTRPVVSGNRVGGALLAGAATAYILQGNLVTGALDVDDAGDAGGLYGILVANRAATIASGGAPNLKTVVVANQTTDGGGNTNFNTAPGTAVVITNNNEV